MSTCDTTPTAEPWSRWIRPNESAAVGGVHEVRVRGVLLLAGQPMRLVEQSTPFEFRSEAEMTFAAFAWLNGPDGFRLCFRWPAS
jgi:hypothetical protein